MTGKKFLDLLKAMQKEELELDMRFLVHIEGCEFEHAVDNVMVHKMVHGNELRDKSLPPYSSIDVNMLRFKKLEYGGDS